MAWVVAVLALSSPSRRGSAPGGRRAQLAELTAQYWQLKYDHGELKAKVAPAPAGAAPTRSRRSCRCRRSRGREGRGPEAAPVLTARGF